MDTNGTRYGSWRPPEASPISSTSVELAGSEVMAPITDSGLSYPVSMGCKSAFLECVDMQQVMEELAGVERVCNSMIARLPSSTNPPNECLSDNSQAGVQENNQTNFQSEAANFPSTGVSQARVFVDLSSDDESREDGEVVQDCTVTAPVNVLPPFQHGPFPNAENYQFKRKGLGVNNGQEDVDYEAHVFQVPRDLLQINDNEVDEATWNERAELLAGGYKAEFSAGIQETRLKKKQKAARKEKVTFMQDQIISIDSDNEDTDKIGIPSIPTFIESDAALNWKNLSGKDFTDIIGGSVVKKLKEKTPKISAEERAEKRKEKEKEKALVQERREDRWKRKLLAEKARLSKKEKEDQDSEEDYELRGRNDHTEKSSKKVVEPEEEVRQITSRLNGEKVVYEPYVWRNNTDDIDEEDSGLDDVWQDMATVVAVSSTLNVDPLPVQNTIDSVSKGNGIEDYAGEVRKVCEDGEHVHIDFDEDMGYYCDHCGAMDLDLPQEKTKSAEDENSGVQKKPCDHKFHGYKDEVGQYCLLCGLVRRDIQKTFIAEAFKQKTPAKPKISEPKEHEVMGATSRVNLRVRDVNSNEEPGIVEGEIDLHLHPLYDEKLHPHQRDGFTFLTKNLLGDKHGASVGCILAHAPGTGKTFLMVSFIQSFLARFPEGRPIILAPKIMLKTWKDEFEKFKVEDIPTFDLNGCNPVGVNDDEEEGEGDSCLPAHVKLNLKENRAKVLHEWQGSRGVLLMSYTLFAILTEKGLSEKVLLESLDHRISKVLLDAPDLVVLDEGHLARTKKTKILRCLMRMRTKRRVLLSGTLFQNNFKELYTLLKLCREDFMTSRPDYARRLDELCGASVVKNGGTNPTSSLRQKTNSRRQHEENIFTHDFGDILENYVRHGVSSEEETERINSVVQNLRALTASFVHWYPGKILETLPGLVEFSVHLNLTELQEKVISELPTRGRYHMSRYCKVLAACIHPSLVKYEENIERLDPERLLGSVTSENLEAEAFQGVKIEFIVRIAELCVKANEKLLIFSTNLVPLSYIEEVFIRKWAWVRGQQIVRLDGTMAEHDRQAVISLFNNKQAKEGAEAHVLMASIKACKEGITLVGASRVIIIDSPDNPSVVRQAVSRAFRIGQKRKVYVYRLVTNNREEEELFNRSVNKEKLSKVLLDRVGKTTTNIGEFLQELSPSEVKDELLSKLVQDDGGRAINVIYRYNASGLC
ncbi:protein Mpsnf1.15 [Marchantia polymorpha subsp. ruderalis]